MLNKESSSDVVGMGEAGLRFAEQFEMKRVLAAFERELLEAVVEAKAADGERTDASQGG